MGGWGSSDVSVQQVQGLLMRACVRACITASTWGNGRLRKGSRVPFGEEYIIQLIQYIPSLSPSTSPTIQIHACGVLGSSLEPRGLQ